MENFVIRGNVLYSENLNKIAVCEQAYLVCKDGKCDGVYDILPQQYRNFTLYDYGDMLIVPGLVDTHIHAPQYAFRGTGMDLELLSWLDTQAFTEEARYSDKEYAQKAYSIFAQQMQKSATTRAIIFATQHVQATEILMELMEASGLICYVGKVNMDRNAPDSLCEENAEISAAETVRWLENTGGRFKNTKPILTPRFIPSCSDELLLKLREIRKNYNLPVQSHLSENREEIDWVKQLVPQAEFYADAYDIYDLFRSKTDGDFTAPVVMAHCVYSSDEEIALIKRRGVMVSHCPASNMNLSSGIAPVRRYLDMGIKTALGSDVAGGHSESIFRAITDAIQLSKLYWRLIDNTCRPLAFEEAFYMATAGGGQFFGRVGKFEKGYEFDALVLDDEKLPCPRKLSPLKRLERFAYLGGDTVGIKAKFVAGNKVI